jgi:choice-of-anchor A domain-containing protein
MRRKVKKQVLASILSLAMSMPMGVIGMAEEETTTYNGGSTIAELLRQFQFTVLEDVNFNEVGHTISAVAVGGSLELRNTFGDVAFVPSYVFNSVSGELGTGWHSEHVTLVYYGTSVRDRFGMDTWVCNREYMNLGSIFESVQEESERIARQSQVLNAVDGVVNIDCTGDADVYVTIDVADFGNQNRMNICLDVEEGRANVDWFKKHTCVISVTGIEDDTWQFNGYYPISINGQGIYNQLMGMSGKDGEYGEQLNFEGMNLMWNFPDATGTIVVSGLSGHLVAPGATVYFNPGNYEGGLIVKNLTGGAEGHFYPMTRPLMVEGDIPVTVDEKTEEETTAPETEEETTVPETEEETTVPEAEEETTAPETEEETTVPETEEETTAPESEEETTVLETEETTALETEEETTSEVEEETTVPETEEETTAPESEEETTVLETEETTALETEEETTALETEEETTAPETEEETTSETEEETTVPESEEETTAPESEEETIALETEEETTSEVEEETTAPETEEETTSETEEQTTAPETEEEETTTSSMEVRDTELNDESKNTNVLGDQIENKDNNQIFILGISDQAQTAGRILMALGVVMLLTGGSILLHKRKHW